MLSRSLLVTALLAAAASASPCKPPPSNPANPPTPTLPSTGASDLPSPGSTNTLVKIAIGHGLQNYTCTNSSATVVAFGALAVLYDITDLYPGTPNTGLSADAFASLSTTVLWSQAIPLNLQDPAAAASEVSNDTDGSGSGTSQANTVTEAKYGAVVDNPFIAPADLTLGGMRPIPFLGRHYFDATNSPTFDLTAVGMLASVAKTGNVKAPGSADKGLLGTGAVDWLQLKDNARGISKGLSLVYRVVTAGGTSQSCADLGAPSGSVPYTAQYWFYS